MPEARAGARDSVERWFLFDDHVYPGVARPEETVIHAVDQLDADLWEQVEAGCGRWVIVEAIELR